MFYLCVGTRRELSYKFKHVFTSYSYQREIFDHVAYPLLEELLKGKNALLFTYGVTGSGKTYTLTGDVKNPGIMPRCIYTLFNTIQDSQTPKFVIKPDRMNGFEVQSESEALQDHIKSNRTNKGYKGKQSEKVIYENDGVKVPVLNEGSQFAVFVSYVEIYNNTVYDLLDDTRGKSLQSKILREDCNKNMYVNGVIEIEVKSAEEAFDVFNTGQNRKRMGDTALNAVSSRSHSIFNIRVVQIEQQTINHNGEPMIPEGNHMQVSQLSLVDLAGSERTNRTQNTGTRLKEASSINNSLMALRNCIDILRENQMKKSNRLVPYRDNKLTLLFKNYFEGEGSVQMMICINPTVDDFEENLQVMKFAEISQDVKIVRSEIKNTPIRMKPSAQNGTTPRSVTKTKDAPISMLPSIPRIEFNTDDPEAFGVQLNRIIECLRARKKRSIPFNREISQKEKEVRSRLVDLDKDSILSKTEIKSLKAVIQKERSQSNNYRCKITDLENNNDSLSSKLVTMESKIRELQNKLNEKDRQININHLEKEKQKQKLELQREKHTQELDAKLRRQREYMNANTKAKDQKLMKIKEVIDSELVVTQDITEIESQPNKITHLIEKHREREKENQTPHRGRNLVSTSTPANKRRSRSVGEVWLEHNAVKPVPLGTVLQPSMKKRKSVTKLSKAEDVINPKQSKYCLIAQEPDTDGEMETKLYKADIVPTCGGGAQVVFNDVECLRQESPN